MPKSLPHLSPILHDQDAEEATLGALLLGAAEEPGGLETIRSLSPADFFNENHAKFFQAILDLLAANMAVDQVTVAYKLLEKGQLDESYKIHGAITPADFYHLLSAVPTSFHLDYYAHIVLDCSHRRQLIAQAGKLAKEAYDTNTPPSPPTPTTRKGIKFAK